MKMLGETTTKGYKPTVYKNQPVHSFYDNLLAVLKVVDPTTTHPDLFAKPNYGGNFAQAIKIQWMTGVKGNTARLTSLEPERQSVASQKLIDVMFKIRDYSEKNSQKSGREKEYADFLKAIAVSSEVSYVLVDDDNNPILIHWGFVKEGEADPNAAFLGWQHLVDELKVKVAEPLTSAIVQPTEPQKPVETSPFSGKTAVVTPIVVKESNWWKWLLFFLLILLLLLLLLRSCSQAPTLVPVAPDSGRTSLGQGMPGRSDRVDPKVNQQQSAGQGEESIQTSPAKKGVDGANKSGSSKQRPLPVTEPTQKDVQGTAAQDPSGIQTASIQGIIIVSPEKHADLLARGGLYSQVITGNSTIRFSSQRPETRWKIYSVNGKPLLSDKVFFGGKPSQSSTSGKNASLNTLCPVNETIDFFVVVENEEGAHVVGNYNLQPEN